MLRAAAALMGRAHVEDLPGKQPKVTLRLHCRSFEWLLWESFSDAVLTLLPKTIVYSFHLCQRRRHVLVFFFGLSAFSLFSSPPILQHQGIICCSALWKKRKEKEEKVFPNQWPSS